MPSKNDDNVIMVCAAAYTIKRLEKFDYSNIIGNHISQGKLYHGESSDSYRGAFTFYDNKPHFAYDDWTGDYSEASSKGGCGFAQDMMIHNGQVINYSRDRSSTTEFRALCLLNDNLAVIDSKGKVAFGDFVSSLSNIGVQEAIYLDMGNWKHSWYRDDSGKAIDIYGNPNKYATNWITFYKV